MGENQLLSYCFMDANGNILDSKNENMPMVPASNMKVVTAYLALRRLSIQHKFETSFRTQEKSLLVSGGPTFFLDAQDQALRMGLRRITAGSLPKNEEDIILSQPMVDNKHYNSCWEIGDSRNSYQPRITNFFVRENCEIKKAVRKTEAASSVIDHQREEDYRPLRNPEREFRKSILEAVRNSDSTPSDSLPSESDSVVYSAPISEVISHILSVSCNFYAEVLFKASSFTESHLGSWEDSIKLAVDYLNHIDGHEDINIRDGSGLCKDNYLTPFFLANLLRTARRELGQEFVNLLPRPGSGTLRNRLLTYSQKGIRAKTGTLFSVSALSGYLESSGTVFSIIMNNSLNKTSKREEFIDDLLSKFASR